MNENRVHADARAALTRLQKDHPELKKELDKSWGFAVFPSVGRASAVLGGAYGQGEVFEQGKPIGFATLSQISIGVQIGGQTFSEVVIFPKKKHLDEFKEGKVAFTANASGVIVKAAASGTTDFDGVVAHAYSRGGMLLEASLGGQKFMFIPPKRPLSEHQEMFKQEASDPEEPEEQEAAESDGSEKSASEESKKSGEKASAAPEGEEEQKSKKGEDDASTGDGVKEGLKQFGAKVLGKVREAGGKLPILKKEAELHKRLHSDVVATLERMKAKDESLAEKVDDAYAYAVFPAVGKASLVVGGSYGKGEVFRDGKLEGYAALIQLTAGLQVGGQTYSELVLFQDKDALKRLKEGKIGFAANASAVIVKGGAAATNNYKQGMQIFVHTEGGMAAEAAIGGQKIVYRPAGLMRKTGIGEASAQS